MSTSVGPEPQYSESVLDPAPGASVLLPDRAVRHGEAAVVQVSGFPAESKVVVAQCRLGVTVGASMPDNCDLATAEVLDLGADGAAAGALTMRSVLTLWPTVETVCPESGCTVGVGRRDRIEAFAPIVWVEDVEVPGAPLIELSSLELDASDNSGSVAVSGTGFAPGSTVNLEQCPAHLSGAGIEAADCILEYGTAVVADERGNFSVTMTVYPLFQRSDGELIDCAESPDVCAVAVPWPPGEGTRIAWTTFDNARP